MPNHSDLPRHMLGIGYCAERDPNGECSHLGMGKQRHVFSSSARDAFNAYPRSMLVDRNVSFVPGPVDHWGNVPPTGGAVTDGPRGLAGATDTDQADGKAVNDRGPFAGAALSALSEILIPFAAQPNHPDVFIAQYNLQERSRVTGLVSACFDR